MSSGKSSRAAFQAVELDEIDTRLEARAAEKGIPTLVVPAVPRTSEPAPKAAGPGGGDGLETPASEGRDPVQKAAGKPGAGPRPRAMINLKAEIPDYAWVELKKRVAEERCSLRFFVMDGLRAKGIYIDPADMVEDGRKVRGGQ
jgi:hypothetical protein